MYNSLILYGCGFIVLLLWVLSAALFFFAYKKIWDRPREDKNEEAITKSTEKGIRYEVFLAGKYLVNAATILFFTGILIILMLAIKILYFSKGVAYQWILV